MQTSVLFFIRNHSSVLGALAFVLVASASSGCSTEPCPDGTKQDGDVCRRIPAMMKNANQGAGSGAMKPDDGLDEEDLDNPGKAGKGGAGGKTATGSAGKGGSSSEEETDGEEGSSGKGGSGGKGGAGGSKAGAGGGGAGGMKATGGMGGAAGKGGTSGAAAGKGAGGMGAAGKDAAAGGGAGKDAAAGSGAAGKGEAGKGEAGSKATEIPDALLADTWFCVNIEDGCVCVDGKGENSDTCSSPRPKCCYVLTDETEPNCQCHDEDSDQCKEEGGSKEAVKVDSCPPKKK